MMVAVLGGGISGLSTAYFLQKLGHEVVVLEGSPRAGGCIHTVKSQEYLIEKGPNSLLADQELEAFLGEIGLTNRILPVAPVSKNRYIFRQGKYQKLPTSPISLFLGNYFSFQAKKSIWKEWSNRSTSPPGETVATFFARRFSQELVDYAVDPFIAGIYAGDPNHLLIEKTFPQLLAYEQGAGSVIKGVITQKAGGRKNSFSFKQGMQELTDQLASLVQVRTQFPVMEIGKTTKGFVVRSHGKEVHADKLVVSLPAHAAAQLLQGLYPNFAQAAQQLRYPQMYVMHSVFPRKAVRHPLNGFGGLHPRKEGLLTAGSIWSSSLFPNRCPHGQVLLTTFIGGMQYQDRLKGTQLEIQEAATAEIRKIYQISSSPLQQHMTWWEKAIPQYDRFLLPVEKEAMALEKDQLYISANWLGGISVGDCIKQGKKTAAKIDAARPLG
jgi:oxygen-dependent protoporphyrinogen oxidase